MIRPEGPVASYTGTESKQGEESHRELPAASSRRRPWPTPTVLGLPLPLQEVRAPTRPPSVALVLAKAGPALEALALALVITRLALKALLLLAHMMRGVVWATIEAVLRWLREPARRVRGV